MFGDEPSDHAIGRSRGGLTNKTHLVCDGKGRALGFVITARGRQDKAVETAREPGTAFDEANSTGRRNTS